MAFHSMMPAAAASSPRKSRSLAQNFSWTLSGNVGYGLCQWGMLVVMAKLGTPDMIGQFSLAFAITAPIMLLADLQLSAVQATDARQEFIFGEYFGLRLITASAGLAVIAAVAFGTGFPRRTGLVILAVGLAKAIESIGMILYGLFQRHERMDRVGKSMMLKGALSVAALFCGIYFGRSLLAGIGGLVLAWSLVLLAYDLRNARFILANWAVAGQIAGKSELGPSIRPHWDRERQLRMLGLASPLGLVMLLISVNGNMPRYFIEKYGGAHELGIYSAMAYPMVALAAVMATLGLSACPRLAQIYADGQIRSFRILLGRLVLICASAGAAAVGVAVVAGPQILSFLYRPEYARRASVFEWLMIAAALSAVASILNHAMNATRSFRAQIPLFALVMTISAAGCAVFVPRFGLSGAAVTQVLAMLVQAIASAVVVYRALYKRAVGAAFLFSSASGPAVAEIR